MSTSKEDGKGTAAEQAGASASAGGAGAGAEEIEALEAELGGMSNPEQFAQHIQAMLGREHGERRGREAYDAVMQLLGQKSPEQFQRDMQMAMAAQRLKGPIERLSSISLGESDESDEAPAKLCSACGKGE